MKMCSLALALLVAASLVVAPSNVLAGDHEPPPPTLQVTAIPWVSTNAAIPHVALNGAPTTLKAIAEGGHCNGDYRYRWDINGDGDFEDEGEGDRQSSAGGQYAGWFAPLEAQVTFPPSAGDRLWISRVRVWCEDEQVTAVYPVLQRVDRVCDWGGDAGNGRLAYACDEGESDRLTRSVLADRAIDDGLWYLFKGLTHGSEDVDDEPVHYCSSAEPNPWFSTGQYLLAAMRRGHNHNDFRESNPYYRHYSQCGLHYILKSLNRGDVSERAGHTADIDENGYGLHILQAGPGYSSYQAGTIYEPLAFFGAPDYVAPVGIAEVRGRTLREIGQDGADWLVDAMGNYGAGDGCEEFALSGDNKWGWEYEPRQAFNVDHSTNGWPGEALRILERKFGTETYQFGKDRQACFLKNTCGASGCLYNSLQPHLAGNGLTSFGWVFNETFDPERAEMAGTLASLTGAFDSFYGSAYRMYAAAKGLRAFSPEISLLPDGRDWHADLVDYLLNNRQADGGWRVDSDAYISDNVGWGAVTGMYVQIMQTWLEAFAYARAEPQLVAPGFPVQLRHNWSYLLDPEVTITTYRWSVVDDPEVEDLNGDGVVSIDEVTWEYETNDPNEVIEHTYDIDIGYDELVNFRVILQVEDSAGRTNIDQDRVQVVVSRVNHAPVVRVSYPEGREWYRGHAATTLELDVSGSFDPDADQAPFPGETPEEDDCGEDVDCRPEGIPDSVTRIEWDLDFDGEFDDAEGTTVQFRIPEDTFEDGERFAVRVRVCDDGQWNGRCYDDVGEDGELVVDEDGSPVNDCSLCAEGDVVIELVGLTPPVVSLEGLPEGPTDQGTPVTLDASGSSDPDDVGLVSFNWDLDGDGEYDDAEGEVVEWALVLPPGIHEVAVEVVDAGGQSTVVRLEIEIVNVPPSFDEFGVVGEAFEQGVPIGLTVVASDPGGDELSTQVMFTPPGGEPTPAVMADGQWWVPATAAGEYTISGTVSDPYEGTAEAEVTVTVDNVGPSIPRVFSTGPVSEGQPIVFKTWSTDPGGDPLTWAFDVGGDGRLEAEGLTEGLFAFTPQGSGNFQLKVIVTDSNGAENSATERFRVNNVDPVILSVFDNGPVPAGEPIMVFVNAYDASPIDARLLRFAFDVGGDGSAEQNGTSPSFRHVFDTAGAYMLKVTVSDGDGSAVYEHEITIEEPIKRVLSPELVVEGEGAPIHFKVSQLVLDAPEEGEFSWTLGDEATAEGPEVTHTYADEGTYVVEVSLDGEVIGRATVVVTNEAPIFLSLPPMDLREGVQWEYAFNVMDPGANDKVTVSVEAGPEGMVLDKNEDGEDIVRWAPTKDDSGWHHVKLRAFDEDGGESWQQFSLFLSTAADEVAAFEGSTVTGGCSTGGPGSESTAGLLLLGLVGLGSLGATRRRRR